MCSGSNTEVDSQVSKQTSEVAHPSKQDWERKVKWHNNGGTTCIGTTSNTADFDKTFYPFDGIFDNSYLTASKSWLSPPTQATCVNQSIVPASLLKTQQKKPTLLGLQHRNSGGTGDGIPNTRKDRR